MRKLMLVAALLVAEPLAAQIKPTHEKVPCRDYKDVFALCGRLGYTQQAWQAGIREVPRVYLSDIPDRWRERSQQGITAADKKRLFLRLIAPIVLRINELILEDRNRAKARPTPTSGRPARTPPPRGRRPVPWRQPRPRI